MRYLMFFVLLFFMLGCRPPEPNSCQPGYVKDSNGDCIVDPEATYDSQGRLLDPACQEKPDKDVPKQVWFQSKCVPVTPENPQRRVDTEMTIGPANQSEVVVQSNPITHRYDLILGSCVLYSWTVTWADEFGIYKIGGVSAAEDFPTSGPIELIPPGGCP